MGKRKPLAKELAAHLDATKKVGAPPGALLDERHELVPRDPGGRPLVRVVSWDSVTPGGKRILNARIPGLSPEGHARLQKAIDAQVECLATGSHLVTPAERSEFVASLTPEDIDGLAEAAGWVLPKLTEREGADLLAALRSELLDE